MCLFHIRIINCYIFSIRFLNINATKCFVGCPLFLLLLSPLLLRALHSHHFVFKPLFYFCWVHSAYGPCSLSVLPPYKNQKSFFLLPDDFTKTPIKNTRYEYSYYALTTQVYFSSCKKWIIYLHIEILQNKWIWLFVWRRLYYSITAIQFFAHFHYLFHS